LSPKKFRAPLPENYGFADELKIIVVNRHDLTWAEEQAARVSREPDRDGSEERDAPSCRRGP
jgi:7-carboxy-7-deazaguanine synthase